MRNAERLGRARRRRGTYQLADVLRDTDIVQEVVNDLQFQEHLRALSEERDQMAAGRRRRVAA